ncbi:MAG: hypothetical protein LBQ66_07415 [Planctomycetaceae bacterium]|nr:hypothetical protein [Planctomycetaceae bacterium]
MKRVNSKILFVWSFWFVSCSQKIVFEVMCDIASWEKSVFSCECFTCGGLEDV